jgi:hypothetical protein
VGDSAQRTEMKDVLHAIGMLVNAIHGLKKSDDRTEEIR